MFIAYLDHQVHCIHCGTTAEKSISEGSLFVLVWPKAHGALTTSKEVHTNGRKCKVYLPVHRPFYSLKMECNKLLILWKEQILIFVCSAVVIPACYSALLINPRRACVARVTVLGLCVCVCVCVCVSVCVCVCLHLFSPYRDQAGSSAIPTALAQQELEKLCGDFA